MKFHHETHVEKCINVIRDMLPSFLIFFFVGGIILYILLPWAIGNTITSSVTGQGSGIYVTLIVATSVTSTIVAFAYDVMKRRTHSEKNERIAYSLVGGALIVALYFAGLWGIELFLCAVLLMLLVRYFDSKRIQPFRFLSSMR